MAALANALEAVRDRIEAETSLSRSRTVETLRTLPDHLQSGSFAAFPTRTTSAGELRPGDGSIIVTDEIEIELCQRIRTADEIGSLDTLLASARSVRIAVTAPGWWRTHGIQCIQYASERRTRQGGWLLSTQVHRLTRQGSAA